MIRLHGKDPESPFRNGLRAGSFLKSVTYYVNYMYITLQLFCLQSHLNIE